MPKLYPDFPLNGNWMMLFSMLAGIATFVIVSLLTCRTPHDMDSLLHRGKYEVTEDNVHPPTLMVIPRWKQILLGYDEHFTRSDRVISATLFAWSTLMFGAFAAISLINLSFGVWSERTWWRWIVFYNIGLPLAVGAVTTAWFTIGGLLDLWRLFARLRLLGQAPQLLRGDDGSAGVEGVSPALDLQTNSQTITSLNALSIETL